MMVYSGVNNAIVVASVLKIIAYGLLVLVVLGLYITIIIPLWAGIAYFLLFLLVFGMFATVDQRKIPIKYLNKYAVGIGLVMQFVGTPFLGFLACRVFHLEYQIGWVLLVITSSPSGTYSNWFCSLFNAELALSVGMTQLSTFVSVFMLPINFCIYQKILYGNDATAVEPSRDDVSGFEVIGIVANAIIPGMMCGIYAPFVFTSEKFPFIAQQIGNGAAVLLLILTAVLSNWTAGTRLWDHDINFYFGVAMPCVVGWVMATAVTSSTAWTTSRLPGPQRVTAAVEGCVPTGQIAASLALGMYENGNDQLALVLSVLFYYLLLECILTTAYCCYMWKSGCTKAPPNVSVWEMVTTSYELLPMEVEQDDFQNVQGTTALPDAPNHASGDHYVLTTNDNDGIQIT